MDKSKAIRAVGVSVSEAMATSKALPAGHLVAADKARSNHFKNRSILLKVMPAPLSFPERRSILKVIEKHGQVDYFRLLPGQQSTFISLMKEKEAAQKLVDSSPIQSAIPASDSEPSRPIRMDSETAPIDKHMTNAREFTITAEAAPYYRHNARSNVARVWPDFIKTGKDFASETLRQSLPSSIAAEGLKYWGLDFGKRATKNPKFTDRVAALNWVPGWFKKTGEEPTQPEGGSAVAEQEWSSNKVAEERAEELSQAKEEPIQVAETQLTKEPTQATEEPTQVAESAHVAQQPQVSTEQPAETSPTRPST